MLAATAADGAAVLPVIGLMTTLARYSASTSLVLLSVGLTAPQEALLCDIAVRVGLSLHIIPMNSKPLNKATLRSKHLSHAAYARLFLPEVLPEMNKIIWLDADTLVLEDLCFLWNVDLGDSLVAAVSDDFIGVAELEATRRQMGDYFNSGVMVINLALWRTEQLLPKIKVLMVSPDLICEDQSVLNIICADRVRRLDHKWNYHASRYFEYPAEKRHVSPAILHFCGQCKPWAENTAFGQIYLRFLPSDVRRSLLASFKHVSALRKFDLAQRWVFGLLTGRKKYWVAFFRAVDLKRAEWRLLWRLRWPSNAIRPDPIQMAARADLLDDR
jgi:lipopolysaccharide biosynthesis glycosyltransferase